MAADFSLVLVTIVLEGRGTILYIVQYALFGILALEELHEVEFLV